MRVGGGAQQGNTAAAMGRARASGPSAEGAHQPAKSSHLTSKDGNVNIEDQVATVNGVKVEGFIGRKPESQQIHNNLPSDQPSLQ